jgi:hypothetical protein
MKKKLMKQKGLSLLIMVIHFTLLLMILEGALFALFNSTLYRVTNEKNKDLSRNLMNIGITYAGKIQNRGQSPEEIFPKERLTIEQIKEDRNYKRYTYRSPSLIKGGFFTLHYYYSEGSLVKVICTGHAGSIVCSSQIK